MAGARVLHESRVKSVDAVTSTEIASARHQGPSPKVACPLKPKSTLGKGVVILGQKHNLAGLSHVLTQTSVPIRKNVAGKTSRTCAWSPTNRPMCTTNREGSSRGPTAYRRRQIRKS